MPDATVEAARDHAKAERTIDKDVEGAHALLDEIRRPSASTSTTSSAAAGRGGRGLVRQVLRLDDRVDRREGPRGQDLSAGAPPPFRRRRPPAARPARGAGATPASGRRRRGGRSPTAEVAGVAERQHAAVALREAVGEALQRRPLLRRRVAVVRRPAEHGGERVALGLIRPGRLVERAGAHAVGRDARLHDLLDAAVERLASSAAVGSLREAACCSARETLSASSSVPRGTCTAQPVSR